MAYTDRFSAELGARLRQARKSAGMSLLDVEKASGGQWKGPTLRAWEMASRAMLVEQFEGVARFYGMDPRLMLAEASLAAMVPQRVAA